MAGRGRRRAPLILAAAALAGLVAVRPAEAGGAVGLGYGHHASGAHFRAHVGYHHRHWRHHHGRFHHHHHGHGAAYTLLGIGIGLLAYDIARKDARAERVYEREVRYVPAPPPPAAQDDGCLQLREYQTTITVGGEEKAAYGDACLMPDGSWRLGAPKLVPEP